MPFVHYVGFAEDFLDVFLEFPQNFKKGLTKGLGCDRINKSLERGREKMETE